MKRDFAAMADATPEERASRLRAWARETGRSDCPLADVVERRAQVVE